MAEKINVVLDSPTKTKAIVDAIGLNKLSTASYPTPDKYGGHFMNQAAEGLMWGGDDEVAGFLRGGLNKLKGDPRSFGENYDEARGVYIKNREAYEDQHNTFGNAALEVAGAIPTAVPGAVYGAMKLAPKGVNLLSRMAATGASTGLEGAAAGYLSGEPGSRGKNAIMGAGLGVGLGMGGQAAYRGGKAGIDSIMSRYGSKNLLKSGVEDASTVGYKMKGGKAVRDIDAREAVRQGVDPKLASKLKGMSDGDKVKVNEMLDVIERRAVDPSAEMSITPERITGDSIMSRYNIVSEARTKAGNELGVVADSLKGEAFDISKAVNRFKRDLDALKITFDDEGALDFSKSYVGRNSAAKKHIEDALHFVDITDQNALGAHELKGILDDMIDYGKTEPKAFTRKTKRAVKDFRKNIDALLDNQFPAYDKQNKILSETIESMKGVEKIAGKDFDAKDVEMAADILGQRSRRLSSNAVSKPAIDKALKEIERVAIKNGGIFNDNLSTQAYASNKLEKLLGSYTDNSLGGIVGGQMNLNKGLGERVLDAGGSLADRSLGKNRQNLVESIRILTRPAGNPVPPSVTPSAGANRAVRLPGRQGGWIGNKVPNNLATGKRIGGKQTGMIGGQNAQNADLDMLKAAQDMKAQGVDADEIYGKTRWWLDHPDGKPRFEIDDSGAVAKDISDWSWGQREDFKRGGKTSGTADDFLKHDDYQSAYGDLTDFGGRGNRKIMMGVDANKGTSGSYGSGSISVGAEGGIKTFPPTEIPTGARINKSTGLHELQHHVQGTEGFAKGGNPNTAQQDYFNTLKDEYVDMEGWKLSRKWDDLWMEAKPYNRVDMIQSMRNISQPRQLFNSSYYYQYSDDLRKALDNPPKRSRLHWAQQAGKYIASRLENDLDPTTKSLLNDVGDDRGIIKRKLRSIDGKLDRIPKDKLKQADSLRKMMDSTDPHNNKFTAEQKYDLYNRMAGEAEARQTQQRMDMSMDERLANPFYKHYDVPLDEQIVRMSGGGNSLSSEITSDPRLRYLLGLTAAGAGGSAAVNHLQNR